MTKFVSLMATCASLALSTAALAQSESAADGQEAPANTADLSVLDTGETITEPGAGDTYVKTTHGDWSVQCLRVETGAEPCQMYQLLRDTNGTSVAEVSIFSVANGGQVAAGGTFVVPLETLLTEKLNVRVDTEQTKRYDFSFCSQVGCYARVGFTADDVSAMRQGNLASVTIIPALAPDQPVSVAMSLTGFTAAFEEITALEQ